MESISTLKKKLSKEEHTNSKKKQINFKSQLTSENLKQYPQSTTSLRSKFKQNLSDYISEETDESTKTSINRLENHCQEDLYDAIDDFLKKEEVQLESEPKVRKQKVMRAVKSLVDKRNVSPESISVSNDV